MSVTNKIKFAMAEKNKNISTIAEALKISNQAVSNKLNRGSFSIEDIIIIADCLGYQLAFFSGDDKIPFTLKDIREKDSE